MDPFLWIVSELKPRLSTTDELLYQRYESQSGRSLPVIYQPFDPDRRIHWHDRGAILDFAASVGDGDLLDFGPGDGWPSLPVAPMARLVVGADASPRRVAVCEENAGRLGIRNFRSVQIPASGELPFPDGSFDGIMAASSVEQAPDPKAALREFYRVLRPGGRLRMVYEALGRYGGQRRDFWTWADDRLTYLALCDRQLEHERAVYYVLAFEARPEQVRQTLTGDGRAIALSDLTVDGIARLQPWLADAGTCILRHPSCQTWIAWLKEAGFQTATPTHGGGAFAAGLFDQFSAEERPRDLAGVTRLLQPLIRQVVRLEAPTHLDAPITAVK